MSKPIQKSYITSRKGLRNYLTLLKIISEDWVFTKSRKQGALKVWI
jgi:hypothetical protein